VSEEYRVSLESFGGPLDLLLFLVKKEEVDIHDIPISKILSQYLEYIRLFEVLDLDEAGEFLVMASTLMLIKSRLLLPTEDVDLEEEIDQRQELVKQLLEYKEIKDSSELLEQQRRRSSLMVGRPESSRPVKIAPEERELEETSLWDLLSAFNKMLESVGPDMGKKTRRIVVDDRPVSAFASEMCATLRNERSVLFSELLGGASTRQEVIGLFLALLLLLKSELVVFAQGSAEDIRIIFCGDTVDEPLDEEEMNEFK
jgi:segregation and condensation protein A